MGTWHLHPKLNKYLVRDHLISLSIQLSEDGDLCLSIGQPSFSLLTKLTLNN